MNCTHTVMTKMNLLHQMWGFTINILVTNVTYLVGILSLNYLGNVYRMHSCLFCFLLLQHQMCVFVVRMDVLQSESVPMIPLVGFIIDTYFHLIIYVPSCFSFLFEKVSLKTGSSICKQKRVYYTFITLSLKMFFFFFF